MELDREQQIEEMANTYEEARYKANETLGSMNEGAGKWYAKAFYNAGYRKASEIFEEIEKLSNVYQFPKDAHRVLNESDYVELKKKYTESENAQAVYKHRTPNGATYITTEPILPESEEE